MRIVVLDGHTLNPGEWEWNELTALGNTSIYDRTPPAEVVERCRDAEIVLTNKTVMDEAVLNGLPSLQYIGVLATGYNVVDVKAAAQCGIVVTNVPAYGTPSVAQATFSLLLELTNRTGDHARAVCSGRWSSCADFCFWDAPLVELNGLTLGIMGFGGIGAAVARIAQSFGMPVIACTRNPQLPVGVTSVPLPELFREADVLSLHCPLTQTNARIINRENLARMKRTALLINTGRGGLIDEEALAEALNAGVIAGAGLDVLSTEPPKPDNPLLRARNCVITPHIAWATGAARRRLYQTAVGNLSAFLAGTPVNKVN